MNGVRYPTRECLRVVFIYSVMLSLLRVSTCESMISRPCFQVLKYHLLSVLLHVCLLLLLLQIATTTCYYLYQLHFTISSPNQCTYTTEKCIGVLGTQETCCILIAGLLEGDICDPYLSEFDKFWMIQLRKTYYCFTNLYSWRPNNVYKNRSVRKHQCPRHNWEQHPIVVSITNVACH